MKIGIYAGTFDPIHSGHIEFAKSAVKLGGLDKVVVVAEKEPYRKKPHAHWDHRQAMIERATESVENVDHDYVFASQLARQHSMKDMLGLAKKHYSSKNEYWFLVGSDVFEHMHQWQDLVENDEYGGFVVALRDNHTAEWLAEKQSATQLLGISAKMILIPNLHLHISSSFIRTSIKRGIVPENVPKQVYKYISVHNLYQ